MSFVVENWSNKKDEFIQNLSETGGYLYIPEKDEKKGIVLKLEKDGIISDAVLSFGYQKAILNKTEIIGTSIKEYNNRFKGRKLKDKIQTAKKNKKFNYTFGGEIIIPQEEHLFDFEKMYQIRESEFNAYKQAEETREGRYGKAEERKDPLLNKIEYYPAEKIHATSNLEKEVLAAAVKRYNKSQIIHNLYQLRQNRCER